jgi:hypothetical protein
LLGPPRALRQIMLIESLPDQRLYDGLAAHVEVPGRFIEFLQHAGRDVDVHALNRLNHAALALEKTGKVFALIGQAGYCIGRKRSGRSTSFLHNKRICSLVDLQRVQVQKFR